jgi:hypothetical protein
MAEKTQLPGRCRFERRQALNLQLGVAMQLASERLNDGT